MQKKQKRQENNQNLMLKNFMNHCALIIQSNFKGYIQRKNYKRFLPVYRRFKQLMLAGFKGWKVRKIMKLQKIKKIASHIKQLNLANKSTELRIAKRDLVSQIIRLSKNGQWIECLKSKIICPLRNNLTIQNISIKDPKVKTNLKQVFKATLKQQFNKENRNNKSNFRLALKKQQKTTNSDREIVEIQISKEQKKQKSRPPINKSKERGQQLKKEKAKISIQLEPELSQIIPEDLETPASQNHQNYKSFVKQKSEFQYSKSQILPNFKSHKKPGISMTLSKNNAVKSSRSKYNTEEDSLQSHYQLKLEDQQELKSNNPISQQLKVSDFDPIQLKLKTSLKIRHLEFQTKKFEYTKRASEFKKIHLK